jgi:hypothetical protein
MTAILRIIDNHAPGRTPRVTPDGVEPGDMWRCPEGDVPGRECWCIALPEHSGVWRTTESVAGETAPGWGVSGDPPLITVTPSIDASARFNDGSVRGWHGFITNGVMTP